jgi:uncharacterized membrane protein
MVFRHVLRLRSPLLCVAALAVSSSARAEDLGYETDIKPLLDEHCVECHHEGARRPNLSAFPFAMPPGSPNDQVAIVTKILAKVDVTQPKMPPGPRPKLTADQVARISLWLEQGLNP